MKTLTRIGLPLVLVTSFFACAKKESTTTTTTAEAPAPTVAIPTAAPAVAHVERIMVVKAVKADKSPEGGGVVTFAKKDPVYVSFWVADAPVGTELKARWIDPKGNVMTEDKIVTDTPGGGYSEFHAAKKSGWAPGTYTVEILMNGQPAGSTTFTVS
jgi:hypothetical protein